VKKFTLKTSKNKNIIVNKIFILVQNEASIALKIKNDLRKHINIIISNNHDYLKKRFVSKNFRSIISINSNNNEKFNHMLIMYSNNKKNSYLLNLSNIIFKRKILRKMRRRIINFHPSYLPYHRGLNAFDKAFHGDLKSGSTTHFCNNLIDGGDIIMQKRYKIDKSKSYFFNRNEVFKIQLSQVEQIISKIIKNKHLYFKKQKTI